MGTLRQRFRQFMSAFQRGEGMRPVHDGDNLARVVEHTNHVTRAGVAANSKVDEHVAKGGSDYTKSFDKKR